ncbi:MAG: 3-deoxy-manno-octulosonate cytidylyltransferase [Calditrichia bacterium]
MILHVAERANQVGNKDELVVATDDERIVQVVEKAGFHAVLTPQHLASGSDRVGWVAKSLNYDIVVNIQGDEPLFDISAVEQGIEAMKEDRNLNVVTLGYPLEDVQTWQNPNVVKIVTDAHSNALYFSRSPIPNFRDGSFRPASFLYQHVGIYIYRRSFLLQFINWHPSPLEEAEKLEQLRILEQGYRIKVVVSAQPSIGVDTLEDVQRISKLMKPEGFH